MVRLENNHLIGIVIIIIGIGFVLENAASSLLGWPGIPPNLFIIGLGFVLIGLVVAWIPGEDGLPERS
jgi:uncharacterized membrane protein